MAISTTISGSWKRLDGDNVELQRRISESVAVTEYGGQKIILASNITDVSILPAGLTCVRTVFIETDNKINVEITGVRTASFDLYADGIFIMMNASLSDIKLSNRSASLTCKPFYDLAG